MDTRNGLREEAPYLRIEYVLFGRIEKLGVGRGAMQSFLFATACACAAVCATAADAQLGKPMESRPVNASDIVGKKICWNDGGFTMFGLGGQFTNSSGPRRVWLVTEPGVVKIGNGYHQIEILPDGSFYQHKFFGGVGSITGHREWWGKVCN